MTSPIRIAPSVLNADFGRLTEEVVALEAAGADAIHWDVMDGRFVPNITLGPDVIAAVRPHTTLPFEAHLMVHEPAGMAERWVEAGCDVVIVHAEACAHLHRTLGAVVELGASAGVALNPATPPDVVDHVTELIDHVLVMTVNPGFGGQRYLPGTEAKTMRLRDMLDRSPGPVRLEVDGGISARTIGRAAAAGATSVVAGSAIIGHPDGYQAAIHELRTASTVRASAPGEAA